MINWNEILKDIISGTIILVIGGVGGCRYNNDGRIKKKYELREENVYTSQSLVEDLKLLIDKIVRIYEIEEV